MFCISFANDTNIIFSPENISVSRKVNAAQIACYEGRITPYYFCKTAAYGVIRALSVDKRFLCGCYAARVAQLYIRSHLFA